MRSGISLVMLMATAAGGLMLLGCSESARSQRAAGGDATASDPTALPAARLVVPGGEIEVRLRQRGTRALPGSDGQVRLTIDDITRGQTMVSIAVEAGESVLGRTSMHPGDKATFTLDQRIYTLALDRLDNQLVGEDHAYFILTQSDGARSEAARNDAAHVLTEPQKIERLIQTVGQQEGAVFIRNGEAYPPAKAAEHMRNKWQWKADEIDTARDFIRIAGTRSSVTGQAYRIRFTDGREVSSHEFLIDQLEAIENDGENAPRPPRTTD